MASTLLVWCLIASSLTGVAHASPQQSAQSASPEQAQALLSRGQPDRAVAVLSPYVRTHPADIPARLLLAQALLRAGQANAAEEQYQGVLQRSPDNYIALAQLGDLYERAGRFDEAEPLLARAVKHSRGEPQLRIEWAEVLTRLHRFREASNALARVSAPPSGDSRLMFFRLKAAIAEGLGDSSTAARDMENALALHAHDPDLQLGTALAQLQARNWGRALNLAKPVFSQTRNPAAGLVVLEAQLEMHQDPDQTLAALRALSLPAGQEVQFQQHLAGALLAHNNFVEAVKEFKRAADLQPGNPDLMFNLALAQFKAGQAQDSLRTAERLKSLRDSAEVEDLLGDIQEALGDSLSAVRSYQAAVAQAPGNENYRISLALEFIRHENFEPARLTLKQAASLFPRSWRIQTALGMVEYFAGTKQLAGELLLRAADLAPRPELVLRYLGDIELDDSSPPDNAALTRICAFARAHPEAAREQYYCGALLLHRDYAARDRSNVKEIAGRLTAAAGALTGEAGPHCELGRLYAWLEQWPPAVRESEACVRLDNHSAPAHYRLAQAYRRAGQMQRSKEQLRLYQAASRRLDQQNEQRNKTRETFLYTIQPQAAGKN
ncbi:MAG TPA: tetratricopeptide repeat protein [Terriglobales bacterium]|nr:tetratricopeptide repeat protein [Terriglobales bacterium]